MCKLTETEQKIIDAIRKSGALQACENSQQEEKVRELREAMNRIESENERLQSWKNMLEEAPGEAASIIRQRCLEGESLNPIIATVIATWREKVEDLERKLEKYENVQPETIDFKYIAMDGDGSLWAWSDRPEWSRNAFTLNPSSDGDGEELDNPHNFIMPGQLWEVQDPANPSAFEFGGRTWRIVEEHQKKRNNHYEK